MASVTPTNPGASDVLQILSGAATGPLSSALASSSVQSALQSASPTDIVQLSRQAQQLVETNSLFGTSSAAPVTHDAGTLLLQAVSSSISVSG